MNIWDILDGLEKVLPILGGITGNPALGTLAAKLLQMGEDEIKRRMTQTGMTRAQVLADAAATYQQFKTENADLKKLGHEADG
jgi:transaldolase